ncbi:hypothetical protein B0H14DRAFT_2395259 [Mycena olivaceomarginata]|nr:hypothetical protein B0H14DRAFT_2395259 [Mycena olivaceomarginata]
MEQAKSTRGQSAKYAYIDGRIPVEIERIFRVQQKVSEHMIMVAVFAIIRRFCVSLVKSSRSSVFV